MRKKFFMPVGPPASRNIPWHGRGGCKHPSKYCIRANLIWTCLPIHPYLPERRTRARCYHYRVTTTERKGIPRDFATVFLDRDGVLNQKMPEGRYVASWKDFHILPGVPEAIVRLNQAGLRVIVVSNQRGIALGLYTAEDVNEIHSRLQRLLGAHGAHIDAFFSARTIMANATAASHCQAYSNRPRPSSPPSPPQPA